MVSKVKVNYHIEQTKLFEYVLYCEDLDLKIRGESIKQVTSEFYEAINRYFDGVAKVDKVKMQKKDKERWMLISLT